MVAIAISRHTPLGVEWINSGLDISCVVNGNFSPQDLELLASIPQHERKAKSLHLWTLKKAFVKATGKGLTIPLDSFYVSTFDKKTRIVERNTFNQQKWFGFTINPTPEHFLSVVINDQNQLLCEVPFYEISQDTLL